MTGATGFIGSYLVPELLKMDHQVVGLCRSQKSAEKLTRAGAEAADAVIHAAFNHDFTRLKQHSEEDRQVIEALGEVLAGSERQFIVTSGPGLAERSAGNDPVVETDAYASSAKFARAATEEAADAIFAQGVRVIVMRLPQVHDTRHQGRIGQHIRLAREKGRVAYVGDGENRLPAVHASDAVRLFRLALEHGRAGARYHAVGEEGVRMRDIAEVIGTGLNLPVESIAPGVAAGYFGELAGLAVLDLAASSALTRQELRWTPTGPDLLTDLRQMEWTSE